MNIAVNNIEDISLVHQSGHYGTVVIVNVQRFRLYLTQSGGILNIAWSSYVLLAFYRITFTFALRCKTYLVNNIQYSIVCVEVRNINIKCYFAKHTVYFIAITRWRY